MHHKLHRRMTDEYRRELQQINKHPTLKAREKMSELKVAVTGIKFKEDKKEDKE